MGLSGLKEFKVSSKMKVEEFANKLKSNADDFAKFIEHTRDRYYPPIYEFSDWISEFESWMANGAPQHDIYCCPNPAECFCGKKKE